MNEKRPLDNTVLAAMITTGAILAGIGIVVWLANTDFGYDPTALSPGFDDTDPAGQFIGASIGGAGISLLVLGWAVAAVCRQIVNATPAKRAVKR